MGSTGSLIAAASVWLLFGFPFGASRTSGESQADEQAIRVAQGPAETAAPSGAGATSSNLCLPSEITGSWMRDAQAETGVAIKGGGRRAPAEFEMDVDLDLSTIEFRVRRPDLELDRRTYKVITRSGNTWRISISGEPGSAEEVTLDLVNERLWITRSGVAIAFRRRS